MAIDAWLTLLQAAESTQQRWVEVLVECGSAQAVIGASTRALAARGLPAEAIDKLKKPDAALCNRWREWLRGEHRHLIGFGTEHYPPLLAAIPDPPLALWVQGSDPALLRAPQLAIVGSRSPTSTGRDTAEQFAKYLGARGLTITSGLATGIDGASHRGALEQLGGTVAVLGAGIDVIFPRSHQELAAKIAARGLLVSEYAPTVGPQRFHFPRRNRIIAGLTLGTLVVEATRRSGSLITARFATDYGREVFAIPGSIHNPLARGCHLLIRHGAKLVEEAADIFVEIAPQLSFAVTSPPERTAAGDAVDSASPIADPMYQNLLQVLDFSPTSIGDLSIRAGLTTAELSSMLLVLELEGLVETLPGGRYSRLGKRD
jgi:DNA processing protein